MIESIPYSFYLAAAPIFTIVLGSLCSLLFPNFKEKTPFYLYVLCLFLLITSLVTLNLGSEPESFWKGAFVVDKLSHLCQTLLLGTALILVLLFKESHHSARFFSQECVSLFLLVLLGMMVMVSSVEFSTIFIGLELSSIGIYVLVGYLSPTRSSVEGAMKYFILGSFASAFLLFGFGFLYATSGTMNLVELAQKTTLESDIWLKLGVLFTLVGIGFKLALIPFHMWAPDAYESAPTGITALMASSAKLIVLVLAIRISQALSLFREDWHLILFILASLSMLGGNFLALTQTSLKRMLAYSSIAHSGYMTIVFCALANSVNMPFEALMFYLTGYTLTSILAFGTLMWLEDSHRQNLHLTDIRGLVKTHPWAALVLTIAILSFAGMPPTVGFFGKFFVFNAALRESEYALVLIGVLGSVISLYYYLRVLVTMYMENPMQDLKSLSPKRSLITTCILGVTCLAILSLGVLPENLLKFVKTHPSEVVSNP